MPIAPDLPNASDALALKALVPALVEACPDLYEMATRFARKILADHAINLDPEQVYWHRFHSSQSNPQTFTGWEHIEHPHDSMTLTQLVITRFTVHDQDNADMLDNDCGFYTAGPEAGTYDQSNEVGLFGSQVLKAFWAFNFLDHYKTAVASFWSNQGKAFRTLAKCTFLAKAIEDREGSRLSDEQFRTVIKAVAGNISWPVTRAMLEEEFKPSSTLRIRRLQVGSYVASDILCIVDADERQILYVPGEVWGFHVLESTVELHWWVMSQVEQPDARKRFMAHFQVADHDIMEDVAALTSTQQWLLAAFPLPDLLSKFFHEPKVENIGLNHLLDLLFSAWQTRDHQMFSVQQAWVEDDAFTHLRDATHARMLSDAGFMMHTNGELRKKLWIGYLNAFGRMFGPLAAVGWPVALAVVGAGIANVGMNIDQAVNGKTPTERKSGVSGTIFAAIDTLFNAMFLKGAERLPEIAQASETVATEDRLAASTLQETEPLLHSIAPERVYPLAQEESFLSSLRTEITEGTREGTGARKGIIETLSGKTYIYLRHGTTSGYFQVRHVKDLNGWVIIDPNNPFAFYRNVPVRLNAYRQWEPVSAPGLKGGYGIFGFKPWGRTPQPLPQVETPATAYDIPEEQRPALRKAADGNVGSKALDDDYFTGDTYQHFKTWRRNLYDDAGAFFVDPPLPTRPALPVFEPGSAFKGVIKQLLKDNPGLVIGENHSSVASKRWLIENMPLLAKQKVKTLYMEHLLTDFHQAGLNSFYRTGEMPKDLERYLQDLNDGHLTDPTGEYTFLEVIKAAQKNHVRVQAIDCMASYRSSGMSEVGKNYRQQMMNYYARMVIEADQAAHGANKWVALLGDSHANTFNGVPGLSELEGTFSLRIEEAMDGLARGIEPDPGRLAKSSRLNPETVPVKNDLRLQMDTPVTVKAARVLGKYLPEGGMYTRHVEQGQMMLVSRDRNGLIKCTPIKQDAAGYFVERPEWTSVDGRRFTTLEYLNGALKARGMRMARPSDSVPASYASNLLLDGETLNTEPGTYFRTYTVKSTGELPSHAIKMNDSAYYVRHEPDVNGPGCLAIVDPMNPNAFNTSIPVRLNARSEWEPVAGADLKGGGKNQSRLAPTPAEPTPGPSTPAVEPFSAYDIPPQALEDTHATFIRNASGHNQMISRSRVLTVQARTRLLRDAKVFFRSPRGTPPRPPLAELSPGLGAETFLEQTLANSPGLVIGQTPGGIGSKQLLIQHMPVLHKAGARILFIKGLITESHQGALNTFHRTGRMTSELRQSLETVDELQGNDPSRQFNVLELVTAAQRNGIRVQALDCMASSPLYGKLPNDGFSRRGVSNYLTYRQIQQYVPAGSTERWVALVDPISTNTYRDLPGISELTGTTSLRIEDVPEGEGSGFMIDPGAEGQERPRGTLVLPDESATLPIGPVTAYSDVRLQLETPWLNAGQKPWGFQLHRPGLYTLNNLSGHTVLIHRSIQRGLVQTPIQINPQGKFYIQAPTWPTMDQRPFDSILDLMHALTTEKSMTLANWSKPLRQPISPAGTPQTPG